MKRLAILSVFLVTAGCGHSPPTRFFTLDPYPPEAPAAAAALAPVQLDAVHIPAVLDRSEVVTEIAANRLSVSDLDHWGAPLGDLMRRAMAEDLMSRLPAGAFVPPDAPKPLGVRGLVVTVGRLQADASGRVELQATWSLIGGHPAAALLTRNVELSTTASAGGAEGQAAAISRLLGQLADRIASALTAPG